MAEEFISVNDIHIGDRIRKSIKSHDITRAQFAEMLGVSDSKVDRILQNRTIDTFLLYDISKKLGINFFSWYTIHWNPEDTGETLYYYHVGKAIEIYMRLAGLSQAVLAEKMGMQQAGISKMLKKNSIDTGRLVDLCYILNHNFFEDFFNNPKAILQENTLKYDVLLEKYNALLIENEHLKTKILDLEKQLQK